MKKDLVIIPCKNCGAELYDRVRKYRMDDGSLSRGSYCPECNANQNSVDPSLLKDELIEIFGEKS